METKTLVWHAPTDRHVVLDHPSQVSDFVAQMLGKPPETSVEVIPPEFHVFDVPYHSLQQ